MYKANKTHEPSKKVEEKSVVKEPTVKEAVKESTVTVCDCAFPRTDGITNRGSGLQDQNTLCPKWSGSGQIVS